jgi:hypothetical protein
MDQVAKTPGSLETTPEGAAASVLMDVLMQKKATHEALASGTSA